MPISIDALVHAPLDAVWTVWTTQAHIERWNAASDDWHTPHAEVDLRAGGRFLSRMEARDGSEGFDFTGTYTEVAPRERIAYRLDDDRTVVTTFAEEGDGVRVRMAFDPDTHAPDDLQRQGWQAILDRFARHAEGLAA